MRALGGGGDGGGGGGGDGEAGTNIEEGKIRSV